MPLTIDEVKRQAQIKHDWTYADYAQLPSELRCEIYDGNLTMSPSPKFEHQLIASAVYDLITAWNAAERSYFVVIPPMDVVLNDLRVVQPDLVVLSRARQHLVRNGVIMGAPDLVVEVLSPSSMRHDRTVKFRYYEEAGVAEYWLVDPGTKAVEVYSLQREGEFAGRYDLLYDGERPEHRWSAVLPGLTFEQPELFRHIPGL